MISTSYRTSRTAIHDLWLRRRRAIVLSHGAFHWGSERTERFLDGRQPDTLTTGCRNHGHNEYDASVHQDWTNTSENVREKKIDSRMIKFRNEKAAIAWVSWHISLYVGAAGTAVVNERP